MSAMQERAAQVAYRGITLAVAASEIGPDRASSASLYLLVTVCNVPGALAARVHGCSRQNVSKLLRAVEERREHPAYEAALAALEAQFSGEDA